MLVVNELARGRTRGGNTQTINHVVKAALQALEQHLTGYAVRTGSLVKEVTELTLQYAIGVLGLLLLGQHDAVL